MKSLVTFLTVACIATIGFTGCSSTQASPKTCPMTKKACTSPTSCCASSSAACPMNKTPACPMTKKTSSQ